MDEECCAAEERLRINMKALVQKKKEKEEKEQNDEEKDRALVTYTLLLFSVFAHVVILCFFMFC